jgi:glutamyl-tRNA(Gln) amidotransferase subunit E
VIIGGGILRKNNTSKYDKYGLKVGLEVHFQLDTGRKLFCRCPIGFTEDFVGSHIIRRLRPTQSELGQVDPAAYFEFKKGLTIEYIAPEDYTCLVEADEEPPHPMDKEALKTVLRIALYLKSSIVDEIHVMRKIVVDGSNTTGFQRTAIVGLGGYIDVRELDRRIPIQTICLEEEAARIVKRRDNYVVYHLDRLGIPLIEIATAPVIHSPEEAYIVALNLGRIVSATGRKRRGLGSVRQDVNISIMDGNVVEVKGVQKLSQLKRVVEFEFNRQVGLYEIAEELRRRGIDRSILEAGKMVDVTELFRDCQNKIIRRGIKRGDRVIALLLKGFSGLIRRETASGYWLGKEFVERVRFWTGIKGIFHTDELPAYKITEDYVKKLRELFEADEGDAIVFVIGPEAQAYEALKKVLERSIEALDGVPPETRGSKEDGTTFYMRPRPGMARMYPETDIPPIRITDDMLEGVKEDMIKDPSKIVYELVDNYDLNEGLAWKLYDGEYIDIFRRICGEVDSVSPSYVASFLTDTLKYLEREGIDLENISDDMIIEVFRAVDKGIIEKESIFDVFKYMVINNVSVEEAVDKLGLRRLIDLKPIRDRLLDVIRSRDDLKDMPPDILKKRLMAIIMSEYRGRVDPKEVLSIIDEVLEAGDG